MLPQSWLSISQVGLGLMMLTTHFHPCCRAAAWLDGSVLWGSHGQ